MPLPSCLVPIDFSSIPGVRVGHATDSANGTGCTALLFEAMSPCGCDIRGGGPASRETPLLDPLATAPGIDAIILAGGSAFGLAACQGAMERLEELGRGFAVGTTHVPLVAGSCIFDLRLRNSTVRPGARMGRAAIEDAERRSNPAQGCVGAGTGATVGKAGGPTRLMKGGVGSYAVRLGNLIVGALFVVNARGDIYDVDTGRVIAGMRTADGRSIASSRDAFLEAALQAGAEPDAVTNTTIGAVVTNARLSKAQACKVAGMAHDGMARAISPVHTSTDGDTVYAASVGSVPASIDAVGILAAEVTARAIMQAVRCARSAGAIPAACDMEESAC